MFPYNVFLVSSKTWRYQFYAFSADNQNFSDLVLKNIVDIKAHTTTSSLVLMIHFHIIMCYVIYSMVVINSSFA